MAFNSASFLLLFLPFALSGYYLISYSPFRWARLPFLILLGVFFYARSQAYYVPLLLISATANYLIAVAVLRTAEKPGTQRWILTAGVSADVALLLFFKYFSEIFNSLIVASDGSPPIFNIVTPLAVSFYTFQQIAFLVDVSRGNTKPGRYIEYLAFTSFFPQLLAGPISLHQEVAPQLSRAPVPGKTYENILIGLIIFSFGLFKKTVIADTFATWADPYFDAASSGTQLGFFPAWSAALTYTLQIYFDFSGYSDMAIGVARMFGILLPLNFFSPFRSRNIAELWQRWHMTLGRFVRIYIFQTLAIPLTRFAVGRKLGRWPFLTVTTLAPTFLSMVIIGTWHGPNWTYVLFGVMHGLYMCIAETYNFVTRKARRKAPDGRLAVAIFTALTVTGFVLAEIPFRANDVPTAMRMFAGILGFHGAGLSGPLGVTMESATMIGFIVAGGLLCFLFPNTEQIMTFATPALEWNRWHKVSPAYFKLTFRFNVAWFVIVCSLLFLGFVFITRGTPKFIYFNF